ncbi:RNA polymerase, alpha chain C terminal domain [Butyrivibrio fibrisolvens]|uniref:RNA polymerase, alpha chain C terminal domain n=1 Tax=Butyrivibrio fibrisolvens TaxID=831 RepID=A0A1H9VJI7_BUTFI|nr:DNA-directed RNA polymerase subunit alpha C-terminal domain-containing protein [Butyrivibrio fibrisolvens]SES21744.1 RNA polymerase, alpha chain C terminal domain [Butyrivibrio fibrisolvens]
MTKNDVITEFSQIVEYLEYGAEHEPELDLKKTRIGESLPIFKAALSFMKKEYPDGDDSYPKNLLMALGILPLEKDLDKLSNGLEYALKTLDEKDRTLILAKYKEELSSRQVAEKYGLHYENSHLYYALHRLGSPLRIKYICSGEEAVINYEKKQAEFTQEIAEIDKKIGILREKGPAEIISSEEIKEVGIYDMAIDDLNLSVRSRNALFRGGYRTLGDFKEKTVTDLMKLRNLGTQSVEEIVTTLAKYGIQIPEDDK